LLLTNTSLFINGLSSYDKILSASEQPLVANFGSIVSYFGDGDAPMMVQYTYPMFFLNTTSIGTDWAVAPTFPGGHSIFGGQCWSIFKYTKNLPLALAFTEFATSQSESVKYMTLDGLFPFRYSQFPYASAYLHISPGLINTVLNLMSTSIQGDNNVPYGPLIGRTFAGEMALVYYGTATPAQAASVITSTAEDAGAIAWTPAG
jgi:spermidine/putrescine-binding protein